MELKWAIYAVSGVVAFTLGLLTYVALNSHVVSVWRY